MCVKHIPAYGIVGYYRSVNPKNTEINTWNKGKLSEYMDRKVFTVNENDYLNE